MVSLETLVEFAKQRGFLYPSSDIYGGFRGVYDYGPLGVELARNVKEQWWSQVVRRRMDIVGLDAGIAMHPRVWEASGHTEGFSDPVVTCRKTGKRFRADHLLEEIGVVADEKMSLEAFRALFAEHKGKVVVPGCDPEDLDEPQKQNLLVTASLGDEHDTIFLRGETCQGIYVNFKNVLSTMHLSLPFGIAQIGKAFRNEIAPRQFLFRTREFEQMELQYFVYPEDADRVFSEFRALRLQGLRDLGLKEEHLRVTPHEHLVFYAKAAEDIEYQYPFGWKELEGIHNRGSYDLTRHAEYSGERLTYFDQERGEHIVPWVIETSVGVGRLVLALLAEAYTVETLPDGSERVVLRFTPSVAPVKVAVLPLLRKEAFLKQAEAIATQLSGVYSSYFDATGSIGKRYRRADEAGVPYAITIDHTTLTDATVTVRDRDSMQQERVAVADLPEYLSPLLR